MTIPVVDPSRDEISMRTRDARGQFKNYARLSQQIINHIDGISQPLNAGILMDLLWALRQSRDALTDPNGIGFGDLIDPATRARLVEDHPVHFPDNATLGAALAAVNSASNAAYAEVRSLLDARKLATGGTLIDYDAVTDAPVDAAFSAAEMVGLRAAFVALLSEFDLVNGD